MTKSAIFILSTGRPEKAAKLAELYRGPLPVWVVTRKDYESAYAKALAGSSATLHVLPQAYSRGIAQARDYAILLADEVGYASVVLSDDDVAFAAIQDDGKHSVAFPRMPGGYAPVAQLLACSVLDGCYGMSCVRDRLHFDKPYVLQVPTRAVGVHIRTFRSLGIRYAFCEPYTIMEDYHAALSMLSRGVPWTCHKGYVCDDGGTQASGGCSEFRTPELQDRCATCLAEEFPEWAQTYEKHGAFGEYLDVKFSRKKIAAALSEASVIRTEALARVAQAPQSA